MIMGHQWRSNWILVGLGLILVLSLCVFGTAQATSDDITPSSDSPAATQQITEILASTPISNAEAPLCRYGVTALGTEQTNWLPAWRSGWWLDFSTHAPTPGVAAEFVQVIRVRQNRAGCTYLDDYTTYPALTKTGLGARIEAAPGAIWLIGNEPDRGPNPEDCLWSVQDNTYPEIYARAYHDTYTFIKQHDPKAQVAIAALVEVTPGRLQYLDKVWQAYQERYRNPMPVDIWNMHLYILPEATSDGKPNGIANIALGTDPALAIRESGGDPNRCSDPQVYCYAEHDDLTIFTQQVVAMRTWMKAHGQQNKPLILSEYSLLYPYELDAVGCFLQDEYGNCFTPQRVQTFMTRTFDYLETATDLTLGYPLDRNRLVQRWMWFSAYFAGAGSVSNLLNPTADALTSIGERFRTEVATRSATINLTPGTVSSYPGYVSSLGSTADVTLYADVLNNGSINNRQPFTVTFYADGALTQPINSVVISETLGGCARNPVRVSTTWTDKPIGAYPFWVKIDQADVIGEDDETDNVAVGIVSVYASSSFFAMVFR